MPACSFVRSFAPSLVRSRGIRSFAWLFVRSLARSFIRSFLRFFVSSLARSFVRWFIHYFIHSSILWVLAASFVWLFFPCQCPMLIFTQQMYEWASVLTSLTRTVAPIPKDARWESPCAVVPWGLAGVIHVNCARRKTRVSRLLCQ